MQKWGGSSSPAITLAILYKLLILRLLPFASVTSSEHSRTAGSPQYAPDAGSPVQNPVQLVTCKVIPAVEEFLSVSQPERYRYIGEQFLDRRFDLLAAQHKQLSISGTSPYLWGNRQIAGRSCPRNGFNILPPPILQPVPLPKSATQPFLARHRPQNSFVVRCPACVDRLPNHVCSSEIRANKALNTLQIDRAFGQPHHCA